MIGYFMLPGDVYAMSLPVKMNKKDAKAFVRKWLGVERLPNNVEFW